MYTFIDLGHGEWFAHYELRTTITYSDNPPPPFDPYGMTAEDLDERCNEAERSRDLDKRVR